MRRLLLATAISFMICLSAHASDRTLSFTVETQIDPISAVGLIMKTNGITQKSNVEFSRVSKGVWKATMPVSEAEIEAGAFASVMLLSSEGDVATSTVRSLAEARTTPIPDCPRSEAVKIGPDTQVGVLQSLVSVRTARRENARIRIAGQLTGDFLETLRRLEIGFGLKTTPQLSADLEPYELIDRLSRIEAALNNYRSGKTEPAQKQ